MASLCMPLEGKSYEEVFEVLTQRGTCVTAEDYERDSVTSSSRFLLVGSILEMYPPVAKMKSRSGNTTKERQVILMKSISPKKVGGRVRVVLVGEIVALFRTYNIKEKDVVCFIQPRITYPVANTMTLSVGPGMTIMWFWKPKNGYNTFSLNGEPDPNEEPIVRHPPRPICPSSPPQEFINVETKSRLSVSRKGSVSSRQEEACCTELLRRIPSLISCCLHHTKCEKNQSILNLLKTIVMSKKRCSEFRQLFRSYRPDSPLTDETQRKKRPLSEDSEIPDVRPEKNLSPRTLSDDENFISISESSSDLVEAKRRRKSPSPVIEKTLNNSNETDVLCPKSPTREVLPNAPKFKKQLYSPRPFDDFDEL